MPRLLFAFLVLLAAAGPGLAAGEPWLIPFPNIAYDSINAYFYSDEWAGLYVPGYNVMYTVSRDSVKIPPVPVMSDSTVTAKGTFVAWGSELSLTTSKGKTSTFALPDPPADALGYLADLSKQKKLSVSAPSEQLHLSTSKANRVWFGLELRDDRSDIGIGGLGWFDTKTERFGRIYTPALAGYSVEWLGVAGDTLHALFASEERGHRQTKLLRYAVSSGSLNEVNTSVKAIYADFIQYAALWGDTLLFTTNETVVMWKPGYRPQVWSTRTYANRVAVPLFLVTFSADSALPLDTMRFQMLPPNKPASVKAQIGDWMELVAPEGLEGYVYDEEWRKNQNVWVERFWNCGDSLCLVRIRIPHEGRFLIGDFTNIPMTYLSKDDNGIKIGFRAGWARKQDLLPVLMPS